MKRKFLVGLVIVGLTKFSFGAYKIGPGDTIKINILTAPEFSRRVIVRPDGKINLPFISPVKVKGMDVEELARFLKKKYSRYFKDPVIEVVVEDYGSQKISILGRVFRPGIYSFRRPITLVEALTMAGGYRYGAALNHVIIVRKGLWADNPQMIVVNLRKILKRKEFSRDPLIQAGDVIYIPDSFLAHLDNFTEFFFSKIRPSLEMSLEAYDVQHLNERYR